ncbi:unnamed protein product [Prorocentrum cordatum]|uniref:Uncharacterized protein n=1 Tax=Prorocentrum cordatum TaxID=2364126 RepID=A0ABN9V8B4_9DINO|nr:unnamed protein product [Polarella glacialis]
MEAADGAPAWAWRELHSGAGGALWAGQSPHLLPLARLPPTAPPREAEVQLPIYLLGLAGGYYAEEFGGGQLRPIRDAVVLEWAGGAGGVRSARAVELPGDEHPLLHGAAKARLADGSFLFFGGGNPAESSSAVSRLRVHPALQRAPADSAEVARLLDEAGGPHSRWAAVRQPDGTVSLLAPDRAAPPLSWSGVTPAGPSAPSARHGLHACVAPDSGEFVIFGGRGDARSPGCCNDVWAFDHANDARPSWREVRTRGTAPPPKVWYGAAVVAGGNDWIIYGGSQWQFEEDDAMDAGVVWVLALRTATWSCCAPAAGSPSPELLIACSLVEVAGGIVVLGGCMPHKLGQVRDHARAFERCHLWYSSLARLWRFDLVAQRWDCEGSSWSGVPEPADTLLRSHAAALVVPGGAGADGDGGSCTGSDDDDDDD